MISVMEGKHQMLWKVIVERPNLEGGCRGALGEGLMSSLMGMLR